MRKIFILLCATALQPAAIAETCSPGYYPLDGECTICPQFHACPDGENIIFCTNQNPAQYTNIIGTGATECLGCPTELFHPEDEFVTIIHYRLEQDLGIRSCRAILNHRTTNGKIQINCSYRDGSYDRSVFGTHCMVDIITCDAGHAKSPDIKWYGARYWTASYDEAANLESCTPVGIGNYSPSDVRDATPCPAGTSTHTDTATSVDDCEPLCTAGTTKLHIGTYTFNIWQDKNTTPALNIRTPSGNICYVNMSPESGTANVQMNNITYHISN